EPPGPGPAAGFISLLSDKETNQRNRSLAGGFFVRSGLFLFNYDAGEFALRQTRNVFVAVAVGLRFSDRATGSDLKSNGGKSKALLLTVLRFVPDSL
ncbi:MAG: hypothetical protein C0623_02325, partial [Desulfuromonas sp.]